MAGGMVAQPVSWAWSAATVGMPLGRCRSTGGRHPPRPRSTGRTLGRRTSATDCPSRRSPSGPGAGRECYSGSCCSPSLRVVGGWPVHQVPSAAWWLYQVPWALCHGCITTACCGHHHVSRRLGTSPARTCVLHERGQASFRDHVETHLVCSQTLLIAWVIDEEPELPVEPAPIVLAVTMKMLHGLSPLSGHGWLKDCAVARGLHK